MQNHPQDLIYFESAEQAVPVIAELLRQEDFVTLARHYQLSGSDVERTDLESGAFFIRKQKPEIAHPAGFWRYKHPFPPSFRFQGTQATEADNIYVITVSKEIDQGPESPTQISLARFLMIKSDNGWLILPGNAEAEKPTP